MWYYVYDIKIHSALPKSAIAKGLCSTKCIGISVNPYFDYDQLEEAYYLQDWLLIFSEHDSGTNVGLDKWKNVTNGENGIKLSFFLLYATL